MQERNRNVFFLKQSCQLHIFEIFVYRVPKIQGAPSDVVAVGETLQNLFSKETMMWK